MTRVSSTDVGERIRAARESAGLTQADLASASVSTVLRGPRSKLGRGGSRRSNRVVSLVCTAGECVVPRTPQSDDQASIAEIRIERLAHEVEFVLASAPSDGSLDPEALPQFSPPATNDDIDGYADKTRSQIGLGTIDPVLDLGRVLELLGVFVFSFVLGAGTAFGATVWRERALSDWSPAPTFLGRWATGNPTL